MARGGGKAMGKDEKAVEIKLFFGKYLTGFGSREIVEASSNRPVGGLRVGTK